MPRRKPILLSDVVNVTATGAHIGLNADRSSGPVVTADEIAGRITVTYTNGRGDVLQRFHMFIVEEQ